MTRVLNRPYALTLKPKTPIPQKPITCLHPLYPNPITQKPITRLHPYSTAHPLPRTSPIRHILQHIHYAHTPPPYTHHILQHIHYAYLEIT